MLISIGILAWDEEESIGRTLRSLFRQTALQSAHHDLPGCSWEIIVVPNGCTDRTADVSRHILEELVARTGREEIEWQVHELKESGKSNAWNRFIHEFSSDAARFVVLLDADIEFREPETLSRAVGSLLDDPVAAAAVDRPLKDAVRKPKMSLLERISVLSSGDVVGERPELCGQFFVARGDALRSIWMPKGLSVEDGFLGAMLVTNCFREPADYRKIIRVEGASHYYETLTSLSAIFHHELRLVVGTALNCYLLWDFLLFATDPRGQGAGILIRDQLERDPDWYNKLMVNSIRNHGWWVLPRGMLLRRFAFSPSTSLLSRAKSLLTALAGFAFDLPVFFAANRRIKKLDAIGFW